VDEASEPIELPAHGSLTRDAEGILGHFADAAWAYRFGPPGHDAVVVTLEGGGGELLGQAFRFPAGRPLERVPAAELGLEAALVGTTLRIASRGLAYAVRVHAPGWTACDDAFSIEPGGAREIELRPAAAAASPAPRRAAAPPEAAPARVSLSAVNLAGRIEVS
jgi:beta-mannosidase